MSCLFAGMRGRGRRVTTSKAQVADEVAAAAPLAAALPAAGTAAQPALPKPPLPPLSTPKSEGNTSPPTHEAKAGRGQGGSEGTGDQPAVTGKGNISRQKAVNDKAAEGKAQLEDVAKLANELQPTGSTLSTMQVHTKVCCFQAACHYKEGYLGVSLPADIAFDSTTSHVFFIMLPVQVKDPTALAGRHKLRG